MDKETKRIYWVWADMLSRCRNPAHKAYKNYGGRGTSVCSRWAIFQNFNADMGPRPKGFTLDREDNSKGYEPENCHWVTRKKQNSNRRSCIYIYLSGEKLTLREVCRRKGLKYRPIVKRIQDRNWPVDLALSVPLGSGKQFSRVPQ